LNGTIFFIKLKKGNKMNTIGFSTISGIGAYLPTKIVTSEELMHDADSRKFGVPETFLARASGIKERRFSKLTESFSDLAILASNAAIIDAKLDPLDIDLILFCGIDRDCPEPSTAHIVQKEIGAHNAECLDVSNACLGILNGLSVANAYIGIGSAEVILICTGEKPSIVTHDILRQLKKTSDKKVFRALLGALTVGDAGGAFIVTKKQGDSGCKYLTFKSEGQYSDLCYYKHTPSGIEFQMLMEKISGKMVSLHENEIKRTYKNLNWSSDSVSKLYCHQVGAGPHSKMASIAGQPLIKVPITYKNYGNLTSATFPVNMALHPPKKGDKVLLLGAGSGLSICQIGIQF
jgi:3-oxoacyl-[acyl-carrier-protein] synthase-3